MLFKFLRASSWCAVFIIIVSPIASADEYHYTDILIGDRASGMGGAYAAVSDDVSGLYYNPAGTAYSTGVSLSASVNAYVNLVKKYENVIGGNGWERRSSSLLPNFFGVIQPIGKFKFGLSYAVPDSINEDQDQTFYDVPSKFAGITATIYRINFNNDDNTYHFGPSISAEIAKGLSAGLTLYYHERKVQSTLNQLIYLSNGKSELTNQYYELHEKGYRPVLGFMWSPMDKVSVGVAFSKIMLSRSKADTQLIFKDTNFPANQIDLTDTSSEAKRKYPLEVRGGIAYFASSSLLVTLDGTYFTKESDPNFGDKINVFNGALGTEYYLSKNWAVRAGVYSNLANTPEVSAAKMNQPEHVDLWGMSMSMSNFTRNSSITLGANVAQGKGDVQVVRDSSEIQKLKELGWAIFLSSSYSY